MDKEKTDVEEAIAKLRSGIGQINGEARSRLQDAFDTVNEHFQRLFTTLFGGGEARLEMIEGEDPLESGLEIVAKPPGKKPATLSLLSGGEQSLTALALIFAVFLTNPSPICVLDEVDAPLDDANVDRFCTLMEKMAGRDGDALPGHHPPPHDHGAHEPPVRRDHGREGREPARLGRPRDRAEVHRCGLKSRQSQCERSRSGGMAPT